MKVSDMLMKEKERIQWFFDFAYKDIDNLKEAEALLIMVKIAEFEGGLNSVITQLGLMGFDGMLDSNFYNPDKLKPEFKKIQTSLLKFFDRLYKGIEKNEEKIQLPQLKRLVQYSHSKTIINTE